MDHIFEKYETPRDIQDYMLNGTPIQNMNRLYFYRWEHLLTELFKADIDEEIMGRGLEAVSHSYQFSRVCRELLFAGLPFLKMIEYFNTYSISIDQMLPGIVEAINAYRDSKKRTVGEIFEKIAAYIKLERMGQFMTYWEQHELNTNAVLMFNILGKFNAPISQDYLMKQLQRMKPLDYPFIPLLPLLEDKEAVYTHLLSILPDYLKSIHVPKNAADDIDLWLNENTESKTLKKSLKAAFKTIHGGYYSNRYTDRFFVNMPPQFDLDGFNKMVALGLQVEPYRMIHYLLQHDPDGENVTKQFNITHEQWGAFVGECYSHKWSTRYDLLTKYLDQNYDKTVKGLLGAPSDGLIELIPDLVKHDEIKGRETLVKLARKTGAKGVKSKLIETFKAHKEGHEIALELITDKKQHPRHIATELLIHFNHPEDHDLLKELYKTDKSALVTDLIGSFFEAEAEHNGDAGEIDIRAIFDEQIKKFKPKQYNFIMDKLPEIRWVDNTPADEQSVKFLINTFEKSKSVIPPAPGRQFGTLFNPDDLKKMANVLYEQWDRQSKTKWMIGFIPAFGDDTAIATMKKEILDMVDRGRGAMASQIVVAMAMIGSPMAFQTVDWFTRKVRHKQVKNAAIGALETAAAELEISKDELLDQIIPDFGFNKDGALTLDYGPRQFTVKIAPDLTLTISDNSGKTFKNLPKPGKNDDADKGAAAKEQLKFIKKEMKTQVKNQRERLERNFSENRIWQGEKWLALFPNHPLMKQFATGLIWGIYENGKLKQALRYDESGSYYNIDDEETTLTGAVQLSLVHPMELTQEENDSWQEQLGDYEIVQPFPQLKRPIFTPKDPEADKLSDFKGYCLPRVSLKSKLFKHVWNRGSVQDAGCYYEYFKEFPDAGIGVELNFLGDCVGGYDDYLAVPIYDIVFYKSGTVSRGSYVYDKPKKEDILKLKDVPPRLFSELYYELKQIAESGEFREEWEKISW